MQVLYVCVIYYSKKKLNFIHNCRIINCKIQLYNLEKVVNLLSNHK